MKNVWFITKQTLENEELLKILIDIISYFENNDEYESSLFIEHWISKGHSRHSYRNMIIAKFFGLIYDKSSEEMENKLTPSGIKFLENIGDIVWIKNFINELKQFIVLDIYSDGKNGKKERYLKGQLYNVAIHPIIILFLSMAAEDGYDVSVQDYKIYISRITTYDKFDYFYEMFKNDKESNFDRAAELKENSNIWNEIEHIRHHQLWYDSEYIFTDHKKQILKLRNLEKIKKYTDQASFNDEMTNEILERLRGENRNNFDFSTDEQIIIKHNDEKEINFITGDKISEFIVKKNERTTKSKIIRTDEEERDIQEKSILNSRMAEEIVFETLVNENEDCVIKKDYMENTNAGYDISKIDSNGNIVEMYEIKKSNSFSFRMSVNEINIANLNPDIYFIIIYSDDGQITKFLWSEIKERLELKCESYNVTLR